MNINGKGYAIKPQRTRKWYAFKFFILRFIEIFHNAIFRKKNIGLMRDDIERNLLA